METDEPKAEDRSSHTPAKDARPVDRLELRGLKCPLPALRTQKALKALEPGAVLEVLADDPLAPLDIAHLCRSAGHALLESETVGGAFHRFLIRRGDAPTA